jgi:hypothetical protein
VGSILEPLFSAFDFFELSPQVIQKEIESIQKK